MEPADDEDAWIGRTLGTGYVIREPIAEGGMGRVYLADQTALERPVAVKLLHGHLTAQPAQIDRFILEARAASRLDHPNSVGIIDFGVAVVGSEHVPFLVMEYLTGRDLAHVLHADGPLSAERAVPLMLDVLSAVAEAHALGIVHRDLKPGNVLLVSRRGRDHVKVVDFGIAQIAREGAEGRPSAQPALLGTPEYAAPEQLRGESVDGRADLYSVGAMLFELLTGKPPFEGRTLQELTWKQIAEPPPDPREVAPDRSIPRPLAQVVLRALAKKREERFASADEMSAALRATLEPDGTASWPPPMPSSCPPPLSVPRPHAERQRGLTPRSLTPGITSTSGSEIDQLNAWRRRDQRGATVACVVGGPAAGKSFLLETLAEHARADGDLVARTAAHPLRVAVPYAPLRRLHDALLRAIPKGVEPGPMERAGIEEMERPAGLRGRAGASRAGAVAAALAAAIEAAALRSSSGRVVILADDACAWDDLSLQALARVPARVAAAHVRIVLATSRAEVAARFGGSRPIALRRSVAGEALADAVRDRLDALEPAARRALQSACVLGDESPLEAVAFLAARPSSEGDRGTIPTGGGSILERVRQSGLADTYARGLLAVHPAVRDVIEASLSAEVRRELHRRALLWHRKRGAPLAVLAEHAARGSEPAEAIDLLERAAAAASRAGDSAAAAQGLERALALARSELGRTGSDEWERTSVRLGAALGDAYRLAGRLPEAEAVLLETFAQCGEPAERILHCVALARVADRRGRAAEALDRLEHARLLLPDVDDLEPAIAVERARAELLGGRSDFEAAAAALEAAGRRADEQGDPMQAAAVALALGNALITLGELEDAAEAYARALWSAREARSVALEADAIGGVAELDRLAGRHAEAAAGFADAARRAADAGDLDAWLRWSGARDRSA